MSVNESIFIGEDIQNFSPGTTKPYGGAFKVSRDLSDLFPNKVINFPISEQAIIGFGIGSALDQRISICEIMFGDFMTLCVDQVIQQASKIPSMFGTDIYLTSYNTNSNGRKKRLWTYAFSIFRTTFSLS